MKNDGGIGMKGNFAADFFIMNQTKTEDNSFPNLHVEVSSKQIRR